MLRSIAIGLIALCLCSQSAMAAFGKRYALVIGVQRYENSKFVPFKYAERDAIDLAAALEGAGYTVTAMTESTGKKDRALKPTKTNIEKSFKAILDSSKKDDLVLVAFAGHGLRFGDKAASYICPQDAEPLPDGINTLISVESLCDNLKSCAATGKILLVDACRNGPKSELGPGIEGDKVKVPAGVLAMFSCSAGELSLDLKDLGNHGVFFDRVLDGLKGKAVDGNDAITFASLAQYVVKKVPEAAEIVVPNSKQTPSIHAGETTGPSPRLARHPLAIPVEEWKEYESVWSKGSTEPFLKKYAPKRLAAWRKSAEAGSARGMMLVADCAEFGVGGKIDAKEASHWYFEGANRGNSFAMIGYGLCYQKGFGVEKDDAEAARWFRKSAELGDPGGMDFLASCYASGKGVDKDQKEAVKWYRKSAELGFGQGMFSLAICYLEGTGLKKDQKEAANWFRKGADAGHLRSMIYLGICYRDGIGIEEDEEEAVVWFRKAAEGGEASAMNLLARCYIDGTGVEKDEKEGATWYKKSAELDNVMGMLNLGICYKSGIGVAKSRAEALNWLRKASEKGNAQAKLLMKELFE
jgi:TPR repeat protein